MLKLIKAVIYSKVLKRVLKIKRSISVLYVKPVLVELEGCKIGNRMLFFFLVEVVIPRANSHSCCLVFLVCQIVELNQLSRELDRRIKNLLVNFFRIG